jgi:hypothetical protein
MFIVNQTKRERRRKKCCVYMGKFAVLEVSRVGNNPPKRIYRESYLNKHPRGEYRREEK